MEDTEALLKDIRELINKIKTPLGSIARDSESRFVRLGQDLQSVFSDAEGLERLVTETAGMISGDTDDKLLSRIGDLEKDALSRLEAFTKEVSGLVPRFEACINQMKRLNDRCPGIIKIAKTLNMISFNISTESSRSEDCEEMFGIFVKEIRELAGKVSDISRRIKEDSENSRIAQENDFSRILDKGNELSMTADRARVMVSENIERIDDVMNLSLKTLQRSEVHSQKISGRVSEIVVAIQFHDIARQQIEHVIEALQDIEGLIRENGSSGRGAEGGPALIGKVHSILRLQALQVEQVILEVREAHRKITEAFNEIGNEVDALVDDVGRMGSDMMDEETRGGAFKRLLSGFERLELVMENGEAMTDEIDRTMKTTRDAANGLSGYLSSIEDVSNDLHIKSINALIMSKRLGKSGVTLSVLAQYVTEVSNGSDEFVREIIDILKAIQASALDLSLFSSKVDEASSYKSAMASSLREGIGSISLSYDGFLGNLELSRGRSVALKKKIAEAGSGLGFLTAMKDGLEMNLKEMAAIVRMLSPFGTDDQTVAEDLANVKSRYTMEIERGIHQRSIAGGERGERGIAKETPDESELGDNVELF